MGEAAETDRPTRKLDKGDQQRPQTGPDVGEPEDQTLVAESNVEKSRKVRDAGTSTPHQHPDSRRQPVSTSLGGRQGTGNYMAIRLSLVCVYLKRCNR